MKLPKVIEKHREYLESTYLPTNEITFSLEETKPWESKLGGYPYLEDTKTYPKGTDSKPMVFLAQINFDEMKPLPDFPKTGILQIFIADNDTHGIDEDCFIKYISEYKKDTTKLVCQNPYIAEYEPFEQAAKITFTNKIMPIGTECNEFQSKFEDKVSEEEWDGLYDFCCASGDRIGGYPTFVQCSLPCYEDGSKDVLLLQLDADGENICGFDFGDSGCCHFFISKEALLRKDFSSIMYYYEGC